MPTNMRGKTNFGGARKVRKLLTTIAMESTTQTNTLITKLMECVIMMTFQLKSIVLLSHACTTIASGGEMNM